MPASDEPALPVEAAANSLIPTSIAFNTTSDVALCSYESVGLRVSSDSHISLRSIVYFKSRSVSRSPTFLLATGYEQVRSIVVGLVGNWEAAKEVHLVLPETGVCGIPAVVDPNNLKVKESSSSCC